MKKNEIEIGGQYVAKISQRLTVVKIKSASPYGGWVAVNVKTGREVRIRTAAKLRRAFHVNAALEYGAAPSQKTLRAKMKMVENYVLQSQTADMQSDESNEGGDL